MQLFMLQLRQYLAFMFMFSLCFAFLFVLFYEYLKWIETYCIFDREGEVASSWMLHEEMFERVNATKENVYDCIKSEKEM